LELEPVADAGQGRPEVVRRGGVLLRPLVFGFPRAVSTEDQYAIDYAAETNDVKFANTVSRVPDSPAIRQAIRDFELFFARIKAYYSDPRPASTPARSTS
jgi:hypothetical protein